MRRSKRTHNFLTAMSPIETIPSHEASTAISGFLEPRQQESSPFRRCPMVHMARLVVIDDLRPALGDEAAVSLRTKYLLFVVELDGEIDDFLDCLYRVDPEFVHQVWGRCLGYPTASDGSLRKGPVFFRRYVEHCALPPELPFAAFVDATVDDITAAIRIQSQLANWIGGLGKREPTRAEWNEFLATTGSGKPGRVNHG